MPLFNKKSAKTKFARAELKFAGARASTTCKKAFNTRERLTRADDAFPVRFLKTPMPFGPFKGNVEDYYTDISDYY
jgi:aldehyde:ferredoxin oxidoreductase